MKMEREIIEGRYIQTGGEAVWWERQGDGRE